MPDGKFHIITFGCQMNDNDSAWLARALSKMGFAPGRLEEADLIFLNTCSVREKPEQKVHSALGRIKQFNPKAIVGVGGCVAQQLGAGLMRRHQQVRLITGSDGLVQAPWAFAKLLKEPELHLSYLEFTPEYPERDTHLEIPEPGSDLAGFPADAAQNSAVASVNIMQGCDNFCAYCIVPFTRGPRKSRSMEAVLQECRTLLATGAKDITLLGQNVNVFGDTVNDSRNMFPDLLAKVAGLSGLRRLRFVTAHPRDFSDDTIRVMAESPQICPRLHLPVQAGANKILQRMGRGYSREEYLSLVEKLRRARPDLALSTDLIVGFPGETEEDFQQTLDLVEQVGFMSCFSFCYSDRPGTRAAAMPDKIPGPVQLERLDRLHILQNKLSMEWLENRTGTVTEVLIEELSQRQPASAAQNKTAAQFWQGRDPWGDLIHVDLADKNIPDPLMPSNGEWTGMFVPVRIMEAKKHSLLGRVIWE